MYKMHLILHFSISVLRPAYRPPDRHTGAMLCFACSLEPAWTLPVPLPVINPVFQRPACLLEPAYSLPVFIPVKLFTLHSYWNRHGPYRSSYRFPYRSNVNFHNGNIAVKYPLEPRPACRYLTGLHTGLVVDWGKLCILL